MTEMQKCGVSNARQKAQSVVQNKVKGVCPRMQRSLEVEMEVER
jgi:hypothetical protein